MRIKVLSMKRYFNILIVAIIAISFAACDDKWGEHYGTIPETVDASVWDEIKKDPSLSTFVSYMVEFKLDSIFDYTDVYTLFVPTNEAFEAYMQQNEVTDTTISFHILRHFIQPNNILGTKKIQTILFKFAQFENTNGQTFYDGIPLDYTSPLFNNGRYFKMSQVATPDPSLYEYIAKNIPVLRNYIDKQDSIVLDKELSKPIGFDDEGNIVYDSVVTIINLFEEEFFEVSEEFRVRTATLAFPKQDLYNNALTQMALNLGGDYNSYNDISLEWQEEILIPYLLEHGVFQNMREIGEFATDSMKNILGDSVFIFYRPTDKVVCSNGYAYNFTNFEILDSLYMSALRTEGEYLVETIGMNRFAWHDSVKVTSSQTFTPTNSFVNTASNDTVMVVNFPKKYDGQFELEFKSEPLFPRRYLVLVRTHMDYGGIYNIYINDELVKTFDWYDYARARGSIINSVTGVRFIPQGRFNKFDFWLDNQVEYGKAVIRFEYVGPGVSPTTIDINNGLMIDYIEFLPENKIDDITKNP